MSKAVTIAYKPVGLLLGAGAGVISGMIFKQVWYKTRPSSYSTPPAPPRQPTPAPVPTRSRCRRRPPRSPTRRRGPHAVSRKQHDSPGRGYRSPGVTLHTGQRHEDDSSARAEAPRASALAFTGLGRWWSGCRPHQTLMRLRKLDGCLARRSRSTSVQGWGPALRATVLWQRRQPAGPDQSSTSANAPAGGSDLDAFGLVPDVTVLP